MAKISRLLGIGGLGIAGALAVAACASNPRPAALTRRPADARAIVHLLNRAGFGPRPGDIERIQATGLAAYIDEQLHPERLSDEPLERRLADLPGLRLSARAFATDFYQPMNVARQEYTAAQKLTGKPADLPHLPWRLLPIAAVSLPGADKPVTVLQQSSVTPEELRFQRQNQQVMDDLQGQKLLRAVYSERQLEEVLTDFWFNHFNVDARKIEDRPVMLEYERDVIRPHVLGRFRDLLGATAKSPAMLFYLDNWMSRAPRPATGASAASPGLNENYGRELLELHTLGVDGGYSQKDVVEAARCFTGWTMRNPHDGVGFFFNAQMHDKGEKHLLGHTIPAGGGVEDGEQVLDLLVRHPSTARFIATKLVRRLVADDPPPTLVERAAAVFQRTDGDLREMVRVILTSREFFDAYRLKVKSPFEYVASALRATGASISDPRRLVGVISGMGEPLYQCQPPTGYVDGAYIWMNTGTLVSRLNFAQGLAANGLNAAKIVGPPDAAQLVASLFAGDVSAKTRDAINAPGVAPATRLALLVGAPEFQRR